MLFRLDFEHMYHLLQLVLNLKDENDNAPVFPLSQYIKQNIAETVASGTIIINGRGLITISGQLVYKLKNNWLFCIPLVVLGLFSLF